MIERIVKIMNDNKLTPKEFSDILEVPQSIITHITTGRNKVSLNLIIKIKNKFPLINLNWLIFGLNDASEDSLLENKNNQTEPSQIIDNKEVNEPKKDSSINLISETSSMQNLEVEKIIILYKNGIFKEYNPALNL